MPELDLQQLAIERRKPTADRGKRSRRLVSRYVLPLALIVGFLSLVGWAARTSLLPARSVTILPVVVTRAEAQPAGAVLFRSAGWIEPRPTPILVTAMAEGVVEQLFVTEGQAVAAGQELACLVDKDARLALARAKSEVQLRTAEVAGAHATLQAANVVLKQPLHLNVALAEVDSAHAKLERELVNLPFAIRSAQARLELARQDVEGKARAGGAVAGRLLQRAESERLQATADLEALQARDATLQEELQAVERQRAALQTQLTLKTEEHRRVNEANAAIQAAEALLLQAQLAVDAAELRLARMSIRSPIDGRVLALHAQPGKRLMGLVAASPVDASTLLTLYDPQMLQIRADVRLEDIARVERGQPVKIETPAVPEGLDGEVIAATSLTDIQKNTVQVKVSITSPPPIIKPDMLVQITFLEPARNASAEQSAELRLLIPRQLVDFTPTGDFVWLADRHQQTAVRRAIELGPAKKGELVEVAQGLSPTDKLIASDRETLRDGERIRVVGEDTSLGNLADTDR